MTAPQLPPPPSWTPRPPTRTRPRRRVFLWTFLAIQALFLAWIIAGIVATRDPGNCGSLDAQTCRNATDAGAAIGVGLIVFLWAAMDVILGVGRWVVVSSRRRSDRAG